MMPPPAPPPSLFQSGPAGSAPLRPSPPPAEQQSLLDLLYDGFYMLFLVRGRSTPAHGDDFRERIREFLAEFERASLRHQHGNEDAHLAKFAFCALVDEIVLRSSYSFKDEWQRRPLQLQYFGDQLAGESFFAHLESLRQQGAPRVQLLEVFHMCLLMGFQGKYLLEGPEKLAFLIARLGDEIAHLKGKTSSFAPHWQAPDRVRHALRHEVPLWVVASVLACVGLAAFVGLRAVAGHQTAADLQAYNKIIGMPAKVAHLTITLP